MKYNYLHTIVMCILMLTCISVNAQESFTLLHKFTKGTVDRYKATTTYSSNQEMSGQQVKVSGSTESTYRIETETVLPDGNASVIYSLEEMLMSVKTMGMDTTMSQADLIGKKNRINLNQYGEGIKSEAIDSINVQGFNIGVDFGASSQQTFIILPHKSIVIGEKWEGNASDSNDIADGKMTTNAKYEYILSGKEIKNGHNCLKINIKTIIEVSGKMKNMGFDLFIEGTGDVAGTIWFDPIAGKMIADESASTMDMTIAMTGQMQMTIPSTISVKSARKLIEQ